MPYNSQHYETFVSLLKLWGLPQELANPISNQLANVDNGAQDILIQTMTRELLKKQKPPQV